MYYFELLEQLFRKRVRYLIVGGLAVNLHGVPRVTQDVDLIISMDKENILKMITILEELGYQARLPVDPKDLTDPEKVRDWVENRNMKAFSFFQPEEQYKVVDIVIEHPLEFEQAYKNRSVKTVRDIEIFLASLEDLITTKESAGREQDLSDIEMLRKVEKNGQ